MNSYAQFNNAIVSMRRVNSFLVSESQNKKPSKELNDKIRSIDFNNVSLKINESIILEKINISLFPGNVYGIYGKSGSGKSSLFNLLCGFLNPTGGEILINKEYPINDIEDWNKKIGLVEKENQLFTDTILSNLKYGNFDKSIEDVFLSMEMASFEKVVKSLEKGWDTHINETGTMLSDGEKQRISIARAFLKKPELILLDEATSALDSELELSVIQNIKKHFKDSIIIIITHKLSSIERFDKVFNIDNKRIEPANNCSLKLI
jgi:ATP-binding cassette subfamily B protein